MGSQQPSADDAAPQQALDAPLFARIAAWPYFSLTRSLIGAVLTAPSFARRGNPLRLDRSIPRAAFRVQESQECFQRRGVRSIPNEGLLALGRDQLVDPQLLEV